jgi:hypothetical protein
MIEVVLNDRLGKKIRVKCKYAALKQAKMSLRYNEDVSACQECGIALIYHSGIGPTNRSL